jgi:hypothetical protein
MLRSTPGENDQISSIGSDCAKSSQKSRQHQERQSRPFAVEKRGNAEQNASRNAGKAPDHDAQQNRGLQRQIAAKKIMEAKADPDSQRQRDANPEHQVDFLFPIAFVAEQERLELHLASKNAGGGRSYANLDQQVDEDETLFHEVKSRGPRREM